jgi:hypothetical protein
MCEIVDFAHIAGRNTVRGDQILLTDRVVVAESDRRIADDMLDWAPKAAAMLKHRTTTEQTMKALSKTFQG